MNNAAFPALSLGALRRVSLMDAAVVCIVLLGVASLLWTRHLEHALTELRTLIIEPVVFFALMRMARPGRQTLLHCFVALMFAGVIVSLIGLYEATLGAGTLPLQSVYGSPNNVGLLLGRTIPLSLAFILALPNTRLRWVAAGCLAVMLLALMLTQSIGAILLGVPVGIVFVIVGRFGRGAIGPLVALAAVGAVGLLLLSQSSAGFAAALDFTSGTNFVRLRLWESAIAMIRDRPITGLGLDQFLYYFGGEYVRPDAIWDADLSHPHNFILDFWLRLSVFGLAVFVVIQFVFWRLTASMLKMARGRDPLLFAMTVGLGGSMAALLAHGLVDNSVFVIDLAFVFMFQLAAIMRLRQLADAW